jgi:hypothetical protein
MNRPALCGTTLVALHAVVAGLHRAAHEELHIDLSQTQWAFVIVVITVAPVLAAVLLWTPLGRAGAWLLALSMAGSFAFGAYYHFIAMSNDHVSQVPAGRWGTIFEITAYLLAFLEALACGVGVWAAVRRPAAAFEGKPLP